MQAVIPVGKGRPATLPHVSRALEAYTDVTEIITVGAAVPINSDLHIDSPNDNRLRHFNVLGHLAKALEHVSGPFMWTADDIFPLQPWTPGVYVRKDSIAAHLRRYANRGHYSIAMRASIEIIKAQGYDPEDVPCGPIHRPWIVDPDRARTAVELVKARGEGEWKAVYVAGLDGTVPIGDAKIFGFGVVNPKADMVSVDHTSWKRNAGRFVRERFTEPSRWE